MDDKKPRYRHEIRCSKEDKKHLKNIKDIASIFRWTIYRVELIRFLMKMEREHKRDSLSIKELLTIELLIFKNGQV